MKIHRLVQMLGLINESGRLASDMYELNDKTYYSEAEGRDIPISHMDFQHMVRAFVKQNAEDVKVATRKANDVVDREAYQVMWDNCEKLKKDLKKTDDIVENNDKIYKKNLQKQEDNLLYLTSKIENMKAIIEEKEELIDKWSEAEHRWRKAYQDVAHTNGHYYTFSEVPQDEQGKEFIKNCKKYLNKESYAIRVKGQHLKKELYGQGRAYHGANMEDSTHLRVYIDKK